MDRRRFLQGAGATGAAAFASGAAGAGPSWSDAPSPPVVATARGRLRGATRSGVHRFLGIPYGAPPVGELRWAPPAPVAPWRGERDATTFGNAAPQTIRTGVDVRAPESEDCLYLNVWSANLDAAARQPVMVWIHGGGNLYGAASEATYDGEVLARRGVTLVSLNYRLGAFGFLSHPRLGRNFAVLDHVAALRWVRDNVERFGGDPHNVTVFGQSAGAVAVRTLLAAPAAAGLFHRAVIQSAGFEAPAASDWWSRDRNERAAGELFRALGTDDPSTLRRMPTQAMLEASRALAGAQTAPGLVRTPAQLVWMPVVDGVTVVGDGYPGWGRDVPVMLGTVENEARFFIPPTGSYDRALFGRMAVALAGQAAPDVVRWFERSGLSPYEALDALVTTVIFVEPASETLELFAPLGRPVYHYRFTRVSPGARRSGLLAAHASELPYLFGTLPPGAGYDATDRRLASELQEAWISFARGGVPRSAGAAWPIASLRDPMVTTIGDEISTAPYRLPELARIVKTARDGRPRRTWLGGVAD